MRMWALIAQHAATTTAPTTTATTSATTTTAVTIMTAAVIGQKDPSVAEPPKLKDPHTFVTVQRPLTTIHMFLVT